MKWRPSVSDLASEGEKDPSQEALASASCSWGSLQAPKTSVSVAIKHETGQVQLALENGQVALENIALETKSNDKKDDYKDDKKVDDEEDDKKSAKSKERPLKRPAVAKKKANKPHDDGPSTKKQKAVEERKTFANRTCPPGPDGSAKNAYNTVIKSKICKNKEAGFCEHDSEQFCQKTFCY